MARAFEPMLSNNANANANEIVNATIDKCVRNICDLLRISTKMNNLTISFLVMDVIKKINNV